MFYRYMYVQNVLVRVIAYNSKKNDKRQVNMKFEV